MDKVCEDKGWHPCMVKVAQPYWRNNMTAEKRLEQLRDLINHCFPDLEKPDGVSEVDWLRLELLLKD